MISGRARLHGLLKNSRVRFERARLQPCREKPLKKGALAPEGKCILLLVCIASLLLNADR